MIVDPLIKIAGFSENDNCQAGYFAAMLEGIAVEKDLTILLTHHVNKQSSRDGITNQISARGASAIVDESRAAFPMCSSVVNVNKNSYVGVAIESPKLNYVQPQPSASFFKTIGGIPVPERLAGIYGNFGIYTPSENSIKIPRRKYTKKSASE